MFPDMSPATADTPIRPPRLRAGARVALLSPAGPVAGQVVDEALHRCDHFGFEGVVGRAARERHGYLAGRDSARAADLEDAIRDPSVDAIWALRGGYGSMRLLRKLDLRPLRSRPKAFIGFSDNTALHLAFDHAGLVSFHGPHAGAAFPAFTEQCFRSALMDAAPAGTLPLPPDDPPPTRIVGGTAEGPLAGGNLALLAAACGTSISLSGRGRIVIVEEVGEAAYRIDRTFTQLILAGGLDDVAGFVLGRFTNRPSTPGELAIEEILHELLAPLGVPVILGAPFGHIDQQWTLPLGVRARLDADRGTLTLLEPAVTA
jgi:muramoyltetrapeptide carboxypeptidase